jgi:hypothetical protein
VLGFRCFSVLEVGLFVDRIQKEISRWRGLGYRVLEFRV